MNNSVFGKTMENVRKHRDINVVTTEKRRNYLVLEPNYHTTKFFFDNSLAIETKKVKYEFWKDYMKPKYKENTKLCYMDTDSFIVHIYTDIVKQVEARFDTSNYELDRPLQKRKNKKVIGLMKDELQEK